MSNAKNQFMAALPHLALGSWITVKLEGEDDRFGFIVSKLHGVGAQAIGIATHGTDVYHSIAIGSIRVGMTGLLFEGPIGGHFHNDVIVTTFDASRLIQINTGSREAREALPAAQLSLTEAGCTFIAGDVVRVPCAVSASTVKAALRGAHLNPLQDTKVTYP